MHGFRLDVETHIVTAAAASVQNLIKSIRGAGVEIDNLVLSPLAVGETVLSADERNAGVIAGIVDTLHDPAAATSVGLLFWGVNHESEDKWRMEALKPGVIGTLKNGLLSARRFIRRR
jgi:hypothetical protein